VESFLRNECRSDSVYFGYARILQTLKVVNVKYRLLSVIECLRLLLMKDYLFILLNIFMLLPCFQGTGLTGMKLVEEPHTVSLPLEYLVQYV